MLLSTSEFDHGGLIQPIYLQTGLSHTILGKVIWFSFSPHLPYVCTYMHDIARNLETSEKENVCKSDEVFTLYSEQGSML
jgi:hypothetical protein